MNKIELELTGDPGDGNGSRTARFVMVAGGEDGLTLRHTMQYSYPIDGQFGFLTSLFGDLIDEGSDAKQIFISSGSLHHVIELDFTGYSSATDPETGNDAQWGDGTSTGIADATGDDPLKQIHTFTWWLRNLTIDSASNISPADGGPATLHVGEYSSWGSADPLRVVFQDPVLDYSGRSPSTMDGSITCVEAADLDQNLDASARGDT